MCMCPVAVRCGVCEWCVPMFSTVYASPLCQYSEAPQPLRDCYALRNHQISSGPFDNKGFKIQILETEESGAEDHPYVCAQ